MRVCVYDTPAQCGKAAAMMIAARLINKPDTVLGLATGSTPIPCYQELIAMYRQGVISFDQAISFNLDEYVGIPEDHVCSYHRFMKDQLFDHINIRPEATHVPDGNAADLEAVAAAYDAAIAQAGGIDIQVLGIGRNGHIGFNEPGTTFIGGCHVVELTANTIDANKRFFASEADVPRKAISLGIGSIMASRTAMLLATGASKAKAIHDTVYGTVTPYVQASILQMHPNAVLIVDREAASML